MIKLSARDIDILRPLATAVREQADRPVMAQRRDLWRAHNDLTLTRAPILCDPENSWKEIVPASALLCESDFGRELEYELRRRLFWSRDMGDDYVLEPFFPMSVRAKWDVWGMEETRRETREDGAYAWDAPIKDYEEDLKKLHLPVIEPDYALSALREEEASRAFGDILPILRRNGWWWSLGLARPFTELRGLEQMMLDFYDEPDNVRRLMKHIQAGFMGMLDYLEKENLLSLNANDSFIGSHSHGFVSALPEKDAPAVPMNMWGFGEAQETVSVSPAMLDEFILQYQIPILSRFGLNYYGCCEPLHDRMDLIFQIPRLRKVSVSPWADREKMAGLLRGRCAFCWKPNPALVAMPDPDWSLIRAEIRKTLDLAQGCAVEIVLKDLHTLGHDPEKVKAFCRIAREEAERAR